MPGIVTHDEPCRGDHANLLRPGGVMTGGDYSGDGDHAELADTPGHSKAWSDVRCMPAEFETDLKPVAKSTPDATGDKRYAWKERFRRATRAHMRLARARS